ncbi:hypothetical protein [Rhodophyticola sp.]|jgi:hypothetical protein|uniref:hypothetical protein n=1 Tax=Rhodophyticola sp. TaxID=2680032 RepID=UPI003D29CBA7
MNDFLQAKDFRGAGLEIRQQGLMQLATPAIQTHDLHKLILRQYRKVTFAALRKICKIDSVPPFLNCDILSFGQRLEIMLACASSVDQPRSEHLAKDLTKSRG